jgi:hypothetical protein
LKTSFILLNKKKTSVRTKYVTKPPNIDLNVNSFNPNTQPVYLPAWETNYNLNNPLNPNNNNNTEPQNPHDNIQWNPHNPDWKTNTNNSFNPNNIIDKGNEINNNNI